MRYIMKIYFVMNKNKKKAVLLIILLLGFTMFVTSAFADIKLKSEYDQFKDAIKYTSKVIYEEADSYSIEVGYQFKQRDEILFLSNSIVKFNNFNSGKEYDTLIKFCNGDVERRHSYKIKDSVTEYYYTTAGTSYVDGNEKHVNSFLYLIENIHLEDNEDYEKIIDAFVGGLKEHVTINKLPNGRVMYTGSVTERQISLFVNTILSFFIKERLVFSDIGTGRGIELPELVEDVYIKKISGRAITMADGIIEDISTEITFSGKDINEKYHEITFEVFMRTSDIGHSRNTPKNNQ